MGKIIGILIVVCHPLILDAQIDRLSVSSAYLDLLAYSTQQSGAFSFKANTATLGGVKNLSAGFLAEKRYRVADFNSFRAAVVAPVSSSGIGFAIDYCGNARYNESSLSLAYALKTGRMQVGIGFRTEQRKISGYSSRFMVNGEVAMLFTITEKFRAGWMVNNVGNIMIDSKREVAPLILSAGFGFDFSNQFHMGAVVKKVEARATSLEAGLRYQFMERAWTYAGITTATRSFYFGSGFLMKDFSLEFTVAVHPYLGTTPGLTFLYTRKR